MGGTIGDIRTLTPGGDVDVEILIDVEDRLNIPKFTATLLVGSLPLACIIAPLIVHSRYMSNGKEEIMRRKVAKFLILMTSRVTRVITKNSPEVSMQLSNLKRLFFPSAIDASQPALLCTPYSDLVRGREF